MSSDPAGPGTRPAAVIELVGTPGAGKTTLARRLVADLCAAGVPAVTMTEAARTRAARTRVAAVTGRLPERLAGVVLWQRHLAGARVHAVALGWRRPALVRHVLGTQWRRPGVSWRLRGHALRWWFAHAGRSAFLAAAARPGDLLVVDDGFVHRAAGLHAAPGQPPSDTRVRRYVADVPAPDLLVVVTAAPGTCADRVRDRGPWRHRVLDAGELDRHLAHADRAVATAVAAARARGWDVIAVDNDGRDLDAVAAELCRAVLAWRGQAMAGASAVGA